LNKRQRELWSSISIARSAAHRERTNRGHLPGGPLAKSMSMARWAYLTGAEGNERAQRRRGGRDCYGSSTSLPSVGPPGFHVVLGRPHPFFPAPALARQRKTPITRDPPPSLTTTVPFPFRALARRRDPGLPRRATPPPAASLPAPRRPVPHPPRVPVRQVHAKRIRRGGEFRASPRTARPRKFNGVPAPAHVTRAPGA